MRIALVDTRFETIHPFLDGDGRLGRLLIAALLENWQLLAEPLLYLSAYLRLHQAEYDGRPAGMRTAGDGKSRGGFALERVAKATCAAERAIVAIATLAAVRQLADLGMVKEMTEQNKNRGSTAMSAASIG